MIQVTRYMAAPNVLAALVMARMTDDAMRMHKADQASQLAFLREMIDTIIASANSAIAACDAIGGSAADPLKADILNAQAEHREVV